MYDIVDFVDFYVYDYKGIIFNDIKENILMKKRIGVYIILMISYNFLVYINFVNFRLFII